MPKRVGRFTIEHWRDGECIRKVEVTNKWSNPARMGRAV